jgi:hypothetical protein
MPLLQQPVLLCACCPTLVLFHINLWRVALGSVQLLVKAGDWKKQSSVVALQVPVQQPLPQPLPHNFVSPPQQPPSPGQPEASRLSAWSQPIPQASHVSLHLG